MLNITVDTKKIPSLDIERSTGYWQNVMSRLVRDKVAMFAALIILCLLIMAVFGQWITPADPYAASIMKRLKPIGFEGYPLGTDELGRDMMSRLMVGARLSLFMGITPVLLAFAIGSTIGIIAGYAGGKLNTSIMRTIDVFYAFPSVLLAIALSGVLGTGITNSLISLTIVFIPPIARVAESVTTQIRSRDFVEAARASGANAFTIVRVHVLGNVLSPIFVYSTSLIAVSMILASGLSFLGLGVQEPMTSWGVLIHDGANVMESSPWMIWFPGAALTLTLYCANFLGDGMRDALDPKTR